MSAMLPVLMMSVMSLGLQLPDGQAPARQPRAESACLAVRGAAEIDAATGLARLEMGVAWACAGEAPRGIAELKVSNQTLDAAQFGGPYGVVLDALVTPDTLPVMACVEVRSLMADGQQRIDRRCLILELDPAVPDTSGLVRPGF